jgi:glyoxalase-like protein
VRIDHVIYATSDLDVAAGRIEEQLGLETVAGGRHDGMGTHNRIVALGGGYLELLAVADAHEAAGSELGAALLARIEDAGEGLMGWAVSVDDIHAVSSRLGTSLLTITRQGLSAYLTGLPESFREPCLPFFISRDAGIRAPGDRGHLPGIAWIEVAGDAARLRSWLGGARLPVRTVAGVAAVLAVGIGERELRGR